MEDPEALLLFLTTEIADSPAVPSICKLLAVDPAIALELDVQRSKRPELSTLNFSLPPVSTETVSAARNNIAVFVSPE